MSPPDLLLYLSDQHDGRACGYAGHDLVETPNLDAISQSGTTFATAYTACPLCVPARANLLTGRLPQHTGVHSNMHMLRSDDATFLHALAAAGYETVLCGRMHFVGQDQRHGFTRRIHGDITRPYGGVPRGEFGDTFGMGGPVNLCGAGDSPVLAFDRSVVATAVDYLKQDHDAPQCVVVGTYGPHFPYCAPPELYHKYRDRVGLPVSWDPAGEDENPMIDAKRHRQRRSLVTGETEPVDERIVLAARAAYFGMIEEQDRLVGQVREAWHDRVARSKSGGVLMYGSDHGDTCGEHGIFGKQTFYEGSSRIPVLIEGSDIPAGRRVDQAVSIMDLGPTLCELGGADPPPGANGMSLVSALRGEASAPTDGERLVLSEWCEWFEGRPVVGRMGRCGRWKLIHHHDEAMPDQLFDIEADPHELDNRATPEPDVRDSLLARLTEGWTPEATAEAYADRAQQLQVIQQAHRQHPSDTSQVDAWTAPESCLQMPGDVI